MKGLEMKYFVLKPRSKTINDVYAEASRVAMKAYADSIYEHNPELGAELESWANQEDLHAFNNFGYR